MTRTADPAAPVAAAPDRPAPQRRIAAFAMDYVVLAAWIAVITALAFATG